MDKKIYLGFFLICSCLGHSVFAKNLTEEYLRFGVLPLQSPTKLAGMFLPLTQYLGDKLNKPIQFVTSPSFASFMQRVALKEYELIYLNPLQYRRARLYGYQAIAKVASEPFTGILVVRRDGPIKVLKADMLAKQVRIGFPDPDAFAATVMTRQYLEGLGIAVDKQMQVQYFGSQDSALLALHSGLVDIIGTWRPSFRSMPNEIRKDLVVIAETPSQPQMPIAVRSDFPLEDIKTIQNALFDLVNDPQGKHILEQLGFSRGFEAVSEHEYQEVKK